MLLVRKLCQGAMSENIVTFRRVWIFSQLGEALFPINLKKIFHIQVLMACR